MIQAFLKASYSAIVLLACAASASTQELALFTEYSASQPLLIRAGAMSESFHVSAERIGSPTSADNVTAWQLDLEITADAGSIGTIEFDSVSQPEDDYIFEGINSLGAMISNNGDSLLAFDAQFLFTGGALVPDGTSANILELNLSSSANALGSFAIMALPDLGNSEWTDATQPIALRREFDNVRDGQAPLRLAEVFVFLPGDFNGDGRVDIADYSVWRNNLGATDESSISYSGDGGGVGASDYELWKTHFGESINSGALEAIKSVPEPSSSFLVAFCSALCYRCFVARRED